MLLVGVASVAAAVVVLDVVVAVVVVAVVAVVVVALFSALLSVYCFCCCQYCCQYRCCCHRYSADAAGPHKTNDKRMYGCFYFVSTAQQLFMAQSRKAVALPLLRPTGFGHHNKIEI